MVPVLLLLLRTTRTGQIQDPPFNAESLLHRPLQIETCSDEVLGYF